MKARMAGSLSRTDSGLRDHTTNAWFGGKGRPLGILGRMPVKYGGVTALVIYYNEFGFVVAADGLQKWGHEPSRSASIRAKEKSDAQKIFRFQRSEINMAYALIGDIANEDRSFDLGL
jgi:hypothetical protein